MKRRSESRSSSTKKMARKDIVPNALDKFRNGLISPEEFSTENEIQHFAELEKKKIIEEFIPFIMKSKSTVHEVYNMVVELEEGIHQIIQDILRTWVTQDASMNVLQDKDQRQDSDMEEENVEVHTIVKTEIIDDVTVTHEWTSAGSASPEHEDNMEDRIRIVQVRGQETEKSEKVESVVLPTSKEVQNASAIEQTKALFSKIMDFAFNEFKSSLSLEKIVLPVLDPSVKTEMLNKFMASNMDNFANLFQSNANQCEEHRSNLEEVQEGPEIPAKCTPNVREKEKFEKLESLILSVLEDIRLRENDALKGVGVDVQDLKSKIKEMKGFLKENGDFSNDEYRQLHRGLVQAVKIAGKVLLNSQAYPSWITGSFRPAVMDCLDFLLWCETVDVDIRECIPSQRDSPKFKLVKAEREAGIFRKLNSFGLIKNQEISSNYGKLIQDCIRSQATSQKMKAHRSRYLYMEAVYYYWKFRAQWYDRPWEEMDLNDDDSEEEPEGERKSDSEDGNKLISEDGDGKAKE